MNDKSHGMFLFVWELWNSPDKRETKHQEPRHHTRFDRITSRPLLFIQNIINVDDDLINFDNLLLLD